MLFTVTLLSATGAHAAVLGDVQTAQDGVETHDERGRCAGHAKRVDFVAVEGNRISGCRVVRGTVVAVVFFDGE